ncbi:class I SAM-dependent methyltransferase [Alcanivorax sp. 1008]|uniref:class I SAM-dependent methyltransferase n=1 Tax=Alcanivorax sp. 1008 TaxID=2816853 RepID=UPI001D8DC668|nr:class I SAM-dependent methyltransferase [Alcanivorax sp. 1008]MCC1496432.1 class I SAM-dependent methyltransferase [Alcanivorax sp. 1008]
MFGWYEDKVFPRLLDWATRPLTRDRKELLSEAAGRVLEIGVGSGANFPFYTECATEIHGIEPAPALLGEATANAAIQVNPQRFQLIKAGAEKLPYPDNHFDTVVACLVFCTIPDANSASQEVLRVLKPGGKLLVLEHIAHQQSLWRRGQKIIEPVWTPMACGCHLSRDTYQLFEQAGFDVSGLRRWQHPKIPKLAGFMLSGTALKP